MGLYPDIRDVHAFRYHILSRDLLSRILAHQLGDLLEFSVGQRCASFGDWVYFSIVQCSKKKASKNTKPLSLAPVSPHHNQIHIHRSPRCPRLVIPFLELGPIDATFVSAVLAANFL